MTKKETLILFFVLAAAFLSLSSSLWGEFTNWDDRLHIVDNSEICSLNFPHIKTIFTSAASLGYIPLTVLSFAVEYHFFGLNPFVFHLDSLLLHLIVTALIFWLGLRLGLNTWAAGLAAFLFGIHPMHVESVAWISERKDVLYAVFYLLALHSHFTYIEKGKKRFFLLTAVYGILSMLAKPMALSLPLILWLCDWMKGRRFTPNVFWEKIPHLVYIVPIAWVTYHIQAVTVQSPLGEVVLTWIWCSVFYIWKFLYPVALAPLYMRPEPVSFLNPVYAAAIVSLIAFLAIFIRFRNNRWVVFAGLFYVLSIFFLFRFDVSRFNIVADRYMYLPSVGFCFLFGLSVHQGLVRLNKRKQGRIILAMVCLVVLFGALSVKTFLQCGIWKDSLTVWSAMIEYADFSKAYNGRGAVFAGQGRDEEAFQDFNKAIALEPGFAKAYSNRALIHLRRNQLGLALADLSVALKLEPDSAYTYGSRAFVYAHMNRLDLAMRDFNRALEIDPSAAKLYYYRSLAHLNLKQFDAAIADAEKAKDLGYLNLDDYIKNLKTYVFSK